MNEREQRWARFVELHRGKLKRLIANAQYLSLLCANAQRSGFPCSLASGQAAVILKMTDRWNTIGRIVSGVELGKYGVYDGPPGDLCVYAPASMSKEEVQNDIYLGIAWVPAIGIALILSGLASLYVFRDEADQQRIDLANKLLDADRKVIDSGDRDLQARWADWKKQNSEQVKAAGTETPGLVDRLLGSGSGNMVAIGLLGLAALWALTRSGRAAA